MWKTIPEYSNWQISRTGQIRRVDTHQIKYTQLKDGYEVSAFGKNGKRTKLRVHRLVAIAFIPNPKDAATVNHKDGIKTNNHVDNLEWMTHEENIQHAVESGLRPSDDFKAVKYATHLAPKRGTVGYIMFGYRELTAAGFRPSTVSQCINYPERYHSHAGYFVSAIPLTQPVTYTLNSATVKPYNT